MKEKRDAFLRNQPVLACLAIGCVVGLLAWGIFSVIAMPGGQFDAGDGVVWFALGALVQGPLAIRAAKRRTQAETSSDEPRPQGRAFPWAQGRLRTFVGVVWALVPLLSVGLAAWLALVYAGEKLNDRAVMAMGWTFAAGTLATFALTNRAGDDGQALVGLLVLAMAIGGTVLCLRLRPRLLAASS